MAAATTASPRPGHLRRIGMASPVCTDHQPGLVPQVIHARRVRALAGLGPGPALFDCPEPTEGDDGLPDYDDPCGGPVRPIPWAFGVACRRCGAVWDGDERLRQLRLIASA